MAEFQGFNFGQIALEGWLQGRKSAEQRAQFEMEQNRIARQEGLINMFKERDFQLRQQEFAQREADKYMTVQQGDPYNLAGVPVGKHPRTLIDDWIRLKTSSENRDIRQEIANQNLEMKKQGLDIQQQNLDIRKQLADVQSRREGRLETDQTQAETYGTLGLTIQQGKQKKMYPYTVMGTKSLMSDLTNPETANYVTKIIDSYKNNPQNPRLPSPEELQQQISEHQQKGYRKFSEEEQSGLMDFLNNYYGNMKDKMQPSNTGAIRIQ